MATFVKRKNGWQARIHKKGMSPQFKTFKTKAAAERWARQVEADRIKVYSSQHPQLRIRHSVKSLIATS